MLVCFDVFVGFLDEETIHNHVEIISKSHFVNPKCANSDDKSEFRHVPKAPKEGETIPEKNNIILLHTFSFIVLVVLSFLCFIVFYVLF